MSLLDHFHLRQYPFSLTPNTELFFPWDEHRSILEALEFALRRGDGLLKVVGEVGTGKTMLCRLLLKRLAAWATIAYINAPMGAPATLVRSVCREFGLHLSADDDPNARLDAFLLAEHAAGRACILVVDEAHRLGAEGLEIVRLLSNLETETHKLLQIVLFGQAELDRLLARHELRQVAQRIIFGFATAPMDRKLVRNYVSHRIGLSSEPLHRSPVFSDRALDLIAARGAGIPRAVNLIADKSMIAAYAEGAERVEARHVRAAVAETGEAASGAAWWRRKSTAAAVMFGAVAVGLLLGLLLAVNLG